MIEKLAFLTALIGCLSAVLGVLTLGIWILGKEPTYVAEIRRRDRVLGGRMVHLFFVAAVCGALAWVIWP